jgi:hypothetical protein
VIVNIFVSLRIIGCESRKRATGVLKNTMGMRVGIDEERSGRFSGELLTRNVLGDDVNHAESFDDSRPQKRG